MTQISNSSEVEKMYGEHANMARLLISGAGFARVSCNRITKQRHAVLAKLAEEAIDNHLLAKLYMRNAKEQELRSGSKPDAVQHYYPEYYKGRLQKSSGVLKDTPNRERVIDTSTIANEKDQ